MSVFRFVSRLLGRNGQHVPARAPVAEGARSAADAEPGVAFKASFEAFFLVLELDQAEAVAGPLFRRRFRTDSFPDTPRHYVAFARLRDGSLVSLGYVHYTVLEDIALCGGLVIDEQHYRRLPQDFRAEIVRAGGIAENLLKTSFARLPAQVGSIWGHVGDRQSEKVCLRVGFERTDVQFLLAVWRNPDLGADERAALVRKVEALTPF